MFNDECNDFVAQFFCDFLHHDHLEKRQYRFYKNLWKKVMQEENIVEGKIKSVC